MSYANFKIGDYVTAQYIGGNQRNISYDKKYQVININKSQWINQILIRNDAGVKKWFADTKWHTVFKQTYFGYKKPTDNKHWFMSYRFGEHIECMVTWEHPFKIMAQNQGSTGFYLISYQEITKAEYDMYYEEVVNKMDE